MCWMYIVFYEETKRWRWTLKRCHSNIWSITGGPSLANVFFFFLSFVRHSTKYMMICLAIGGRRKFALLRKLHGVIWVDSQGGQHLGVLVLAEAVQVGISQRWTARRRWRLRVRSSHRRPARQKAIEWDVANCLPIGELHNANQEEKISYYF